MVKAYYTVKDDNAVSVFGGESVQDPQLGWVVPCVKTFPYFSDTSRSAADAIEQAEALAAQLNSAAHAAAH